MALWNKKPDPNTQLGDPTINEMSEYQEAMNRLEAERIYREGLIGVDNMMGSVRIDQRRLMSNIYSNRPANDVTSESYRRTMLGMRLHVREGDELPFDSIHTSLGKEKVFVFIVQNDQAVTLEDDRHMFPSDVLITQLRLIQK